MESMNRRSFVRSALGLAGLVASGSLLPGYAALAEGDESPMTGIEKLEKSTSEWLQLLPAAAFGVLFLENTERPFSSPLNDEKRKGLFTCAACNLPLFESAAKFDSGTGWPSFWAPIEGHVATKKDYWLLLPRTEYHCARCGGHQGHLFKDGPKPTGQRWCNNGLALHFVPAGTKAPELRV